VRTSRRAYLIGVAVGQTNVFFFNAEGRQIAGFDIAVTRDLNGIRAALKRVLPDADIRVEGLADGIMLAGSAGSPMESQQAYDLAARLAGDGAKVVNGITVRGRDQVMLRVTVAEVQRDVIKQLGIDLSGTLSHGTTVLDFNNANPFPATGAALVSSNAITGSWRGISNTIRAMERAGVIRTLAEPNLTAISGESANFLAGGEFPIPAGFTCDPTTRNCQTQIQFKKFGVGLNFTPVVLSEGRISLKVLTEVSELSNENALTVVQAVSATQTTTLTIPSIKTRRAETTVEIPSGGALAMAGMIHEQTKQQLNGLPGLMNLPVLGALFKSRDYVNRQSELMVLVTPYIVRAVAQKDLSRPDDGYADASDPSSSLLGRFNRLYGIPGKVEPRPAYRGTYGFILD
jgi:pilus assembly protein CpaC